MREIRFRGKCVESGKLVYGFYGYKDLTDEHFIIIPTIDTFNNNRPQYFTDHLVIPETVGEYTGLKDKNCNEIYEGDIVRASSEGSWGKFEVRWRQEAAPQWILYPAWQSDKFWNLHGSLNKNGDYYDNVEVIGNIYENPELLNKN